MSGAPKHANPKKPQFSQFNKTQRHSQRHSSDGFGILEDHEAEKAYLRELEEFETFGPRSELLDIAEENIAFLAGKDHTKLNADRKMKLHGTTYDELKNTMGFEPYTLQPQERDYMAPDVERRVIDHDHPRHLTGIKVIDRNIPFKIRETMFDKAGDIRPLSEIIDKTLAGDALTPYMKQVEDASFTKIQQERQDYVFQQFKDYKKFQNQQQNLSQAAFHQKLLDASLQEKTTKDLRLEQVKSLVETEGLFNYNQLLGGTGVDKTGPTVKQLVDPNLPVGHIPQDNWFGWDLNRRTPQILELFPQLLLFFPSKQEVNSTVPVLITEQDARSAIVESEEKIRQSIQGNYDPASFYNHITETSHNPNIIDPNIVRSKLDVYYRQQEALLEDLTEQGILQVDNFTPTDRHNLASNMKRNLLQMMAEVGDKGQVSSINERYARWKHHQAQEQLRKKVLQDDEELKRYEHGIRFYQFNGQSDPIGSAGVTSSTSHFPFLSDLNQHRPLGHAANTGHGVGAHAVHSKEQSQNANLLSKTGTPPSLLHERYREAQYGEYIDQQNKLKQLEEKTGLIDFVTRQKHNLFPLPKTNIPDPNAHEKGFFARVKDFFGFNNNDSVDIDYQQPHLKNITKIGHQKETQKRNLEHFYNPHYDYNEDYIYGYKPYRANVHATILDNVINHKITQYNSSTGDFDSENGLKISNREQDAREKALEHILALNKDEYIDKTTPKGRIIRQIGRLTELLGDSSLPAQAKATIKQYQLNAFRAYEEILQYEQYQKTNDNTIDKALYERYAGEPNYQRPKGSTYTPVKLRFDRDNTILSEDLHYTQYYHVCDAQHQTLMNCLMDHNNDINVCRDYHRYYKTCMAHARDKYRNEKKPYRYALTPGTASQ